MNTPERTPAERQRLIAALHVAIKLIDSTHVYNVSKAALIVGLTRPTIYIDAQRVLDAATIALREIHVGRPPKPKAEKPKAESKRPWWEEAE